MVSDIVSDTLLNTISSDQVTTDDLPELSPDQQFLQLYLESEIPALLSVEHLVEIMTISMGQVVPVFQMPPWVMGVYNWRGEVLWMVDLNHLVGFSPWYQQQGYTSKHTTVVVRSQSKTHTSAQGVTLGLVLNRVGDIVFFDPEHIQDPSRFDITSNLKPFLRGIWPKPDEKPYPVLDGEAILTTVSSSGSTSD